MSEETVNVALGDDYYLGAYFRTVGADLDYEVPKAQLERWEAAQAAYGAMQDEIERVMQEQRQSALALALERRKGRPANLLPPALQEAYEQAIQRMLSAPPLRTTEEPE